MSSLDIRADMTNESIETSKHLEEVTRKIANIFGDSSASARAIKKLEQERVEGNVAWLHRCGKIIFVVSEKPRLSRCEQSTTVKASNQNER